MDESASDDSDAGEGEGTYTVRFVVEANYRGWRLDRYLCAKIRRLSRAKAQAIIRAGKLSDRPLKPNTFGVARM